MANDALRRAMSEAKVTDKDLAQHTQVDLKTVQRWLTDERRFPHPRHRWAVSDLLKVDETLLWPEAVTMYVKTGTDREVEHCWPTRADMPNATWQKLFRSAEQEITLAGWTCYFLWLETHQLGKLLRHKAAEGCRVRFLIGSTADPATAEREAIEKTALTLSVRIQVTLDELRHLRGVDGIEARYADRRLMGLSVFRFDQKAIITPHLAASIGKDAPTMLLRRVEEGGLYDRFLNDHVELLWSDATPIW